jgi:predicted dehydrogenase
VSAQPSRGRALVVGFGSIGARHARILTELGFRVSVVSRRDGGGGIYPMFSSIDAALAAGSFDYAVLATETSAHAADLARLAQSEAVAKILVEKPLFAALPETRLSYRAAIHVGYQLRFHPGLRRLRAIIGGRQCLMAQFYVGQHLDDWRPGRAVRDTYSARADKGGGALRDLSHELDLALWLFGTCKRLTAVGGRLSDVTVDSDDAWSILAQFERCPVVSVQMNCLDRIGQRRINVVAEDTTVAVDVVQGTIDCDGRVERFASDRDLPIRDMHRAVLDEDGLNACDFESGLKVIAAIDAVERAGRGGIWVTP